MAAVVVVPSRHPRPARRVVVVPARPPLQLIPGGRRAARQYAADRRPAHRLHPAVYRRRRLGAALAVITLVLAAYLALSGFRLLATDAGAMASSSSAVAGSVASSTTYLVRPGDTLWSIARSLKPSGDVRPLVDQLADRAGPGPLVAGRSLRVDGLGG
jgi:nucleoid-associated protein YgaU